MNRYMNKSPWSVKPAKQVEKIVRGSSFALGLFMLPRLALAQGLFDLLDNFINIMDVLIPVFIGVAVVVFFWGLVKFIAHADDAKAVEEGKQFMVWGIVGLFVIVALWSIVGFIQEELGLNMATTGLNAPTLPTELP